MAGDALRHVEAREVAGRRFRYFDFVMAAFVTILLLSNVLGGGTSIDCPGATVPLTMTVSRRVRRSTRLDMMPISTTSEPSRSVMLTVSSACIVRAVPAIY